MVNKKLQHALILAGGKSSRMGSDKTLLPYKNYPSLTLFLFERLSEIFMDVKVSAKEQKFNPPLPIIIDEFDYFSPIKVIQNLHKHYTNSVFIITADMPFVKYDSIFKMSLFIDHFEIVIAKDSEFKHNLCGFYNPKIAQKIALLNSHKVSDLQKICSTKIVNFTDKTQFININTPLEYEIINKF